MTNKFNDKLEETDAFLQINKNKKMIIITKCHTQFCVEFLNPSCRGSWEMFDTNLNRKKIMASEGNDEQEEADVVLQIQPVNTNVCTQFLNPLLTVEGP